MTRDGYLAAERVLTTRQKDLLLEIGGGTWHDWELNGFERRVLVNLSKHKLVGQNKGVWRATKAGILFADWYALKLETGNDHQP